MKKVLLIVFILIVAIAGGIAVNSTLNTKTKLIYEPLSERENMIMYLTGNNVIMYKLKNIPKGKNYELTMTYEVYENDKKIKDDMILGLSSGEITTEKANKLLGIGFQENKIITCSADNGGYASCEYNMKEDLKKYGRTNFCNDITLELGDEIYIYYATTNESLKTSVPLGVPFNNEKEVIDRFLDGAKSTILIKLSYKEVV